MMQCFSHFRKKQLRLVAQTEQRLGATQFLARLSYLQNFVRSHGVRPGISGIAPKRAVTAIVATQISKWKKNFAGVGDHARFELIFDLDCGLEQFWKIVVTTSQKLTSHLSRDFQARADLAQVRA